MFRRTHSNSERISETILGRHPGDAKYFDRLLAHQEILGTFPDQASDDPRRRKRAPVAAGHANYDYAGRDETWALVNHLQDAENPFDRNDDVAADSFHFDDNKRLLGRAGVGEIEDPALQNVVRVQLHQDFTGVWDVHIANFEVHQTISDVGRASVWRRRFHHALARCTGLLHAACQSALARATRKKVLTKQAATRA
jgi:hypothetical protein